MDYNSSEATSELISLLSYVIDIEKNKKIYHSWRVAIISALIAENSTTPKKLKEIFYAALMHDIGAAGFSFHIIHYLKRHDRISQNILLSHPIIGAQLAINIPQMSGVAKMILDHHEWINGQGYPRAKTAKDLSFGSQVLRIADAIDIGIQSGRFSTLKGLSNSMSLNCGKEYKLDFFEKAMKALNNNFNYDLIRLNKNIPETFKRIRKKVGIIPMHSGASAISKTMKMISQVIDMKHPYTLGHCLRVSRYAIKCGQKLNLTPRQLQMIEWAALIHDIGKLSVSRKILDKPRGLNRKEYLEIKKHAKVTHNIMDMVPSLQDVGKIASGHHERFDGTGYPLGLRGNQIPLETRILSICDAYDAITSNRPYHSAPLTNYAWKEIEKQAGTQFDPQIVKEILPLLKNMQQ